MIKNDVHLSKFTNDNKFFFNPQLCLIHSLSQLSKFENRTPYQHDWYLSLSTWILKDKKSSLFELETRFGTSISLFFYKIGYSLRPSPSFSTFYLIIYLRFFFFIIIISNLCIFVAFIFFFSFLLNLLFFYNNLFFIIFFAPPILSNDHINFFYILIPNYYNYLSTFFVRASPRALYIFTCKILVGPFNFHLQTLNFFSLVSNTDFQDLWFFRS